MHEKAVMDDLVREIESVARAERARRVTGVRVRLGALSHFTPKHFREHFEDATRGTLAEGAAVEAEAATDPSEPGAQGVLLESVELDVGRESRAQ
ncbi:MAG: hydrogenase/urease maturation nickel metallochaperone HypA [Thermoleophilia bacterium]|nr:hydrogenase/urease maturation nickel metallochaperone HypA [Thermoleophilia bacterium]MDH5280529.1 hydrogenase/urease maturation nickel metallochaperone HypA [Thermoleophilia bacterium]